MLDSLKLLRRLDPRSRHRDGVSQEASTDQASFLRTLAAAARTGVSTTLRGGIEDRPLTDGQRRRLEEAVDAADMAGLEKAVMLIDGRAVVIDVTMRDIVQELRPEDSIVRHIDGACVVPESDPTASQGPLWGAWGLLGGLRRV